MRLIIPVRSLSSSVCSHRLVGIFFCSLLISLIGCSQDEKSVGSTVVIVENDAASTGAGLDVVDAGTMVEDVQIMDASLPEPDSAIKPVVRKVLHEAFTGSNCSPCGPASIKIHRVLDAFPDQSTVIKYNIGSDPYISTEAVRRRLFYLPGESSYPIPFVHADGVNGFHPNEVNNDEGYLESDLEEFASVPTDMRIDVSHSIDGKTINVDVAITALADYPSEDLRVFIAIVENVTYNNIGSNGQTEFHYVFKKMLPDHLGIPIGALMTGQTISESRSYTFQGEYTSATGIRNPVNHNVEHTVEEFQDLSVVVFVQDVETWQVHQSEWTTPHDPELLGVVEGRIIDAAGDPLGERPITCCDENECLSGVTDIDGHYRFSGLPYPPRKMEVISPDGVMDVIFVQEVGEFREPVEVSAPSRTDSAQPWPVAVGGTVSLANGALRLTASPDTLTYDVGIEQTVIAESVHLSALPPYSLGAGGTPAWRTNNAFGAAFIINPVKIKATSSIHMGVVEEIAGLDASEVGAQFDVYAVDPDTAIANKVGIALRDQSGVISSDAMTMLTDASVLIVLRQPNGGLPDSQ
jgi:hypothetical protein